MPTVLSVVVLFAFALASSMIHASHESREMSKPYRRIYPAYFFENSETVTAISGEQVSRGVSPLPEMTLTSAPSLTRRHATTTCPDSSSPLDISDSNSFTCRYTSMHQDKCKISAKYVVWDIKALTVQLNTQNSGKANQPLKAST